MTGTTSLGRRTVSVVAAVSCLLIVRCACDDRYKNHRVASKNDTAAAAATETTKFPPARVLHASPPSGATTETSPPGDDAVRLYITPSGKRKQDAAWSSVVQASSSVVQASSSSSSMSPPRNPSPPYYVTASANRMVKTSNDDARDTMNFRTPAAEEQTKRGQQQQQPQKRTNSNNSWQQSQLLYATTQQQQLQPGFDDNVATSTAAVLKSSQSKPFASVFVPKKMLDSSPAVDYPSFRPIASPAGAPFSSYAPQPVVVAVKTTDRAAAAAAGKPQRAKTPPPPPPPLASSSAASYKVEEYATEPRPTLQLPAAANSVFDVSGYNGHKSAAAEKSKQHDQVKRQEFPAVYDPSRYYDYAAQQSADALGDYFYRSAAEKYETAVKPSSSSQLFDYEKPRAKERPGASSSWFGSSAANEDANAKQALRQLLRDVFVASKQPETQKSKSSGVGELIDAYFKTGPSSHAADVGGPDDYDIETDMSCNLRSTKYVTDGHCVTTRPIVEAVCADRCLVYSTTQTSQRQRLSPTASQQVEALHCVDGDVKFLRVQLKCRDGNTLNNIIKVVTNCQCKLHQIQPQMRSNLPISI